MTVSFQLPVSIENHLRRNLLDLDRFAKEAALVELYRQGRLTHHELATSLSLDRFETESLLKRYHVADDCLTLEEYDKQLATLRKLTER